jgi:hypothetical protein
VLQHKNRLKNSTKVSEFLVFLRNFGFFGSKSCEMVIWKLWVTYPEYLAPETLEEQKPETGNRSENFTKFPQIKLRYRLDRKLLEFTVIQRKFDYFIHNPWGFAASG